MAQDSEEPGARDRRPILNPQEPRELCLRPKDRQWNQALDDNVASQGPQGLSLRLGGMRVKSAIYAADRGRFTRSRSRLVSRLSEAGIEDERVLEAMGTVPRHTLIPEVLWGEAYKDQALPIGEGQTISAPGIVARMTQALALTGDERVLEIGTGSGYQAAVLSGLVASVVSVERIPQLAHEARKNLDTLQVTNVTIHEGDGTCGWPSSGPYDRILVTAGGPELPEPVLLQLKVGGALVGPFGPRDAQQLLRVVRQDQKRFSQQTLGACNFVDLIGEHGWAA